MKSYTCPQCSKEFQSKGWNIRYCSRECQAVARRDREYRQHSENLDELLWPEFYSLCQRNTQEKRKKRPCLRCQRPYTGYSYDRICSWCNRKKVTA